MQTETWLRDEYGQGSILGRFSDPKLALDMALTHLYTVNCDNALTLQERLKSWECYLPVVISDGKPDFSILFDENKVGRSPRFLRADGSHIAASSCKIMMLGNNLKCDAPWFIQDFKGRHICSLEDAFLRNKSFISFRQS